MTTKSTFNELFPPKKIVDLVEIHEPSGKMLYLQKARLEDLFKLRAWKQTPKEHQNKVMGRDGKIYPYMEDCPFENRRLHVWIKGVDDYRAYEAIPSPLFEEWLKASMVDTRDYPGIEVIIRSDGSTLIARHSNLIISSWWIKLTTREEWEAFELDAGVQG